MRSLHRLRGALPVDARSAGGSAGRSVSRRVPAPRLAVLLAVLLAVPLGRPTAALAAGPVGGARLGGTQAVADSPTSPVVPATTAASFVLADVDSGAVLAAKDPHGQYAPASTLKTLTAVTLLPRLDLAAQFAPAAADVNVDGTKVGLVTQLTYSVKDLFTALLVTSANDAAGTLATAVGGQAAATGLMNAEATRLQARDTHAVNTSGLDAVGQVSSAYDLALIARAGLALPEFRALVATRRAFIPAPGGATIEIDTHNRLLADYSGAIGIKNGFTEAARASFVGAATRNGHTLVVTLMRGDPEVWKDAATLLDWGFAAEVAGARPVGRLVKPVKPDMADAVVARPRQAAAADVAQAPSRIRVASTARAGGLPLGRILLVVLLVLLLLTGLRRRAVVRARTRRRATTPRLAPIGRETAGDPGDTAATRR